MYKILLVDDETISREMLATYIEGLLGYEVVQAGSGEEALDLYDNEDYPIVISDIRMPGINGLNLLRDIKSRKKGKKTRVVLVTGFAQIETAVEALREGAYDYLSKPLDVNRLADLILKIVKDIQQDDNDELEPAQAPTSSQNYLRGSYISLPGFKKIGVFSESMRRITETAIKLHAHREMSVLIEGESGTGKEIVAALIHHGETTVQKPFVLINCAAISHSLFESEMFGYDSGAFTGGKSEGKIGKIELANNGTLVLDEIGEMPLELQAKMLRVIQERYFYRVGGNKKIDVDVRFIASTNKDLNKLVKENKFRYDLLYRINATSIRIPLLSKQKESIAPLSQMFLVEFAQLKNKKFRLIDKKAINILENHPWHGNVRELKNTIERIVLLYDDYELRSNHLNFLEDRIDSLHSDKFILRCGSFELPDDDLPIQEIEKEIVNKALDKFGGNKSQTAKYLGLTTSSLRSRMK